MELHNKFDLKLKVIGVNGSNFNSYQYADLYFKFEKNELLKDIRNRLAEN